MAWARSDDPRDLGWWCQFCGHRPIAWRYPTRGVLTGEPRTHQLCELCSSDVEEGRMFDVHDRVMKHANLRVVSDELARRITGRVLVSFLDGCAGPRERVAPH